ncbi:hypothetical protein TYRP_012143 [Tyrophagus putrescentiae]|nr:hypothetical protein TYRP_012143 [Tyrophagus putrescentiae]
MTSKNSKKGHDYHQVRKEEGSTGVPTIRLLPKVSALALIFGMGSWIAITGLWLEMPLLIERLPEGWRLASYLNIMIQIANIGPLLYWFARKKRLLNEITATHIQMSIGIASCLVLILAWDWTVEIRGKRHSLVLFVATFGLALVDCTSSVTFLPFMARFDSGYMTPYLVGEGLSGFIPSMFALIQGVGENRKECLELTSSADIALNATAVGSVVNASAPFREQLANLTTTLQVLDTDQLERSASSASSLIEPIFSVEVFFLSLFSTLLISYIGFCTLQLLPEAKQEMANARKRQQLKANAKKLKVYKKVDKQKRTYYYLLALMFLNCFTTFGFFPPVQPYSALPYGVEVLHYIVVLSGLAYPTGCFFGMLVEAKSVRLINLLTAIGTTLALYILACALMSPSPPLVDSPVGGILMVLCWIAYVGILSYSKTMITLWICDYNSRKGMFWVGMNQQFGAATGALLNFILINYSRLYSEC